MNSASHEEWLNSLIGSDSMRTAAQKANYAQTTISRQLSRGHLSPEMVIALCRAYDRSPVTGLIETGYLQQWETEGVAIPYALQNASNKQLLDEILRRSDPEALYLFGDPTGEAIDYKPIEERPTRTDGGTRDAPLFYAVADQSPEEKEGDYDDYIP